MTNMAKMKRVACAMLVLMLSLALPQSVTTGRALEQETKLRVVTTVFPAYDFAREVTGGGAEVKQLLPPGGDSHSYEPSPQDMIDIQNADLFIYTGGESDAWIERILESLGENAPPALAMMDCVTGLTEELSQSMEASAGEGHEHEAESHDPADESHDQAGEADGICDGGTTPEAELDEHVWTSPENAALIVEALAEKLSEIAPESAACFADNAAVYTAKLRELDAAFERVIENSKRRLIVFGDRFPFRYFAAHYGLAYDAAFPGCSEDGEPSVKTVISLVDFIRENEIPVVFYIEFSSRKTADILCEETGARALLFHSCHTVSAQELRDGASYLTLMERNLEALKEALS